MARALYIFTASFGITYYVVQRSGIFAAHGQQSWDVLYSLPLHASSFILLLLTLYSALRRFRQTGLLGWAFVLAVVLLVGGFWVSTLYRYSVEAVITEGQALRVPDIQAAPGTAYVGKYSNPPELELVLKELDARFSGDGTELRGLKGFFQYEGEFSGSGSLGSVPKYVAGSWLTIEGFGYSPRYVLRLENGRIIDSSFVYLDIFPQGKEDYFRLLSPLTYYLGIKGPLDDKGKPTGFRLRIARNKDLVANRDIVIGESVSYENAIISFDEVRRWTKVRIVRDPGVIAMLSGLLLGIGSWLVIMAGRLKLAR